MTQSQDRIVLIVPKGKATAEIDAFRRDLTINSLFYNLSTQSIEDFTKTVTAFQFEGT